MSTHKTSIDQEVVRAFLKSTFPQEIRDFKVIRGGEGSQAYSFKTLAEEYVVRVNKNNDRGFKKDEYAYKHFSLDVPIPKIHKIGKMDDNFYFCISQKVEGKILDQFSKEELIAMNHELFAVLDAIHSVDISGTKGYGTWDESGQARLGSWKEHLLGIDTYAKGAPGYPGLFATTFLEKDFWDRAYARFVALVPHCPEERRLVHADYGFNNVLSDGKSVTGVIDWENSLYGDPLHDIAWLCYWGTSIDYRGLYLEYCKSRGIEITDFDERLLCYKLHIGMGSLSFFAYSNQRDKYDFSKQAIEKLLRSI